MRGWVGEAVTVWAERGGLQTGAGWLALRTDSILKVCHRETEAKQPNNKGAERNVYTAVHTHNIHRWDTHVIRRYACVCVLFSNKDELNDNAGSQKYLATCSISNQKRSEV